MSYLNDLEVVRAKGDGDGSAYGDEGMYPESEHQQEAAEQGYKKISCRSSAQEQKIVELLSKVAFGGWNVRYCGHASEHGVTPKGGVFEMSGIPYRAFARHSLPAAYIALVYYLAAKNLRSERVSEH